MIPVKDRIRIPLAGNRVAAGIPGLSLVPAVLLWTSAALAQEDPFAVKPAKPEGAAPPAAAARPVEAPKREPLVIELLRASNPATAEQLVSAAQSALQFGRADECKQYLAKLLAARPADEALAPLTTRYGDFLFQLTSNKDVQPEGREAANLIFATAQRVTQSSERLAAAIAHLSDSQPGKREEALGKLADAGTAVVNPMLNALADAGREAEHARLRAALVQLGGQVELPLIAALDTQDASLKAQVIAVLARMGARRAAPALIRPALNPASPVQQRQLAAAALQQILGATPDLREAEKFLTQEIGRLLRGEMPYERDADDRVKLWSWDESKHQTTPLVLPRRDAGALLAARAANDLYVLRPDSAAVQRLMLLANFEWAKTVGGLDRPLPIGAGTVSAVAADAGPAAVSQVLAEAMREGRVPAAIAAAESLGNCGDASILLAPAGRASPLADALVFPDRRVRLAAALTALKLAPGGSFVGAGRLSDALGWLAGASGSSTVLIGHPRGEEAQSLVGYMNALGYEGEGAYTGRALAERAFANPDDEFILIADAIDSPPVEELVQWLRRDFRTARQPIGVMARGERLDLLRDRLADDRFTIVFPRIHSVEVAQQEVAMLLAIAGRNLVPRDVRLDQAQAALMALAELAKSPTAVAQYDVLKHEPTIIGALSNPALAADAAALLGLLGTPRSQRGLIDFASQSSQPLADRQAAAAALAAAIKTRGLRLTQEQIARQYARYNASQSLDQPTQGLLGSILDAIEAPAIARGDLPAGR